MCGVYLCMVQGMFSHTLYASRKEGGLLLGRGHCVLLPWHGVACMLTQDMVATDVADEASRHIGYCSSPCASIVTAVWRHGFDVQVLGASLAIQQQMCAQMVECICSTAWC